MSIRIVLADDHRLIREGLRSLLENDFGMEVVGQADNGEMAVQMVKELSPEIVIMDLAMPGLDGIAATSQIVKKFPSVKVIALSMHSNRLFVDGILKAGAVAYLLKESASMELDNAISTVLANEIYLSPKIAGLVVKQHIKHAPAQEDSKPTLTEREYEILRLIANGKSTKEIALHLDKSVQTIDMARRQIMEKLGVDSIAQLVKYAIGEGLTSLEP